MTRREHDPENLNPNDFRRGEYIEPKTGMVIRFELVGIIIAIAIQTFGVVWWGGSFSSIVTTKIDYLQQSIAALKSDVKDNLTERYTSKDAAKDFLSIYQRVDRNDSRLTRIEQERKSV